MREKKKKEIQSGQGAGASRVEQHTHPTWMSTRSESGNQHAGPLRLLLLCDLAATSMPVEPPPSFSSFTPTSETLEEKHQRHRDDRKRHHSRRSRHHDEEGRELRSRRRESRDIDDHHRRPSRRHRSASPEPRDSRSNRLRSSQDDWRHGVIDRFGDVLSAQYQRIDTSQVPRYTRTSDHQVFGHPDDSLKRRPQKHSDNLNLSDLSQQEEPSNRTKIMGQRATTSMGEEYIALPIDDSDNSEPFRITPR